jgi:hypothetical protein
MFFHSPRISKLAITLPEDLVKIQIRGMPLSIVTVMNIFIFGMPGQGDFNMLSWYPHISFMMLLYIS